MGPLEPEEEELAYKVFSFIKDLESIVNVRLTSDGLHSSGKFRITYQKNKDAEPKIYSLNVYSTSMEIIVDPVIMDQINRTMGVPAMPEDLKDYITKKIPGADYKEYDNHWVWYHPNLKQLLGI